MENSENILNPNPYLLSTISCENRGNLCEELNLNKVNTTNRPWLIDPFGIDDPKNSFFNLNEFDLEDEVKVVHGLDKEECAQIALDNNYAGFVYYGDNNMCYQYDIDNFDTPIEDDISRNYDINTFYKSKSTSTIDTYDQHNYDKYFEPIQTLGFVPQKYSNISSVPTKVDCMKKCIQKEKNCKAIMYAEQPKKCIFYNKKTHKKPKKDDFKGDVYTVISSKLNEHHKKLSELKSKIIEGGDYNFCNNVYSRCIFEKAVVEDDINVYNRFNSFSDADLSKKTNVPVYNCDGIYSTNPFCTKQYNPLEPIQNNDVSNDLYYTDCFEIDSIKNKTEKTKFLNELCKNKYGKEYVFNDDMYNMRSIIKCDNDENGDGTSKKALCKMTFDGLVRPMVRDKIEHFSDSNKLSYSPISNDNNMEVFYNAYLFKIIVLLLFFFIMGYLIYCVFIRF